MYEINGSEYVPDGAIDGVLMLKAPFVH